MDRRQLVIPDFQPAGLPDPRQGPLDHVADLTQAAAMRHSLAHILATAIQELYPKAKFGIGPVVENGFYYDVDLQQALGLTYLFISHDLAVVSQVTDRVAVMYAGSIVELGAAQDVFRSPAHPYTRGLLNSVPTLRTDRSQPLRTIEGTVPNIASLPPGCRFEPRCDIRIPGCASELPPLLEIAPRHWARCPVVTH